MVSPIRRTAFILIPVLVEPRLIEEQTKSVEASASGMDFIRSSSAAVLPLLTRAEYPPRKLTPTSLAALSSVFASFTKSDSDFALAAPIRAMGVTEILLLTMGIPNSPEISSPVLTRSFALLVILS